MDAVCALPKADGRRRCPVDILVNNAASTATTCFQSRICRMRMDSVINIQPDRDLQLSQRRCCAAMMKARWGRI